MYNMSMKNKSITEYQIKWMDAFFQDDFIKACKNFVHSISTTNGAKDILVYHSGGGCCHLFVQDSDNYIHSIHNEESIEGDGVTAWHCETSYLKWNSCNEYVDDEDEKGFGFEYVHPNYEDRQFNFIECDAPQNTEVSVKLHVYLPFPKYTPDSAVDKLMEIIEDNGLSYQIYETQIQ